MTDETPESPSANRVAVAGAAAVLVLAAGGIVYWMLGSATPPNGEPDQPARPSASWPAEDGRPIAVRLDGAGGPTWSRDDGPDVRLPPASPEKNISWSVREQSGATVLVGTTQRHGGQLQYRWRLVPGDPQATLSVRWSGATLKTLRRHGLEVTLRLPTDRIRALGRRMQPRSAFSDGLPWNIGPWRPVWLQWRSASRALTLTGWNGDGVAVRRTGEDEALAIDLRLWNPELHPGVRNCETGESGAESIDAPTVRATATLAFGSGPPVVPSPLPDGRVAGLVPIFDTPRAHPDTTLRNARAKSAADWVGRAKTLTFGHSDSADPRYGNGGLLGRGLGGTVVLPARWTGAKRVEQYAGAVADSSVDVAVRDGEAPPKPKSLPPALRGTFVSEKPRCSSLLDDSPRVPAAEISGFEPYRGTHDGRNLFGPGGAGPASVRPFRLDGSRPELVESALATEALESLLEHREVTAVSTPLLGSRNPLIPAAKEALLSPERHGQWTLAAPFATSLTNVALLRESSPLWVGSLADLVRHWRGARSTAVRWNADGELLVEGRGERTLPGFTLLVDGAHVDDEALAVEGADGTSFRRGSAPTRRPDKAPQTWISWRLEPGETYRLQFDGTGLETGGLAPVEWTIRR